MSTFPFSTAVYTAFYALLTYDYLCTLGDEVAYVWSSGWSLALPLFYLNRYLPFVDQGLMLSYSLSASWTPLICERVNQWGIWLTIIGGNVVYTIIYLQTCAIWGNNRYIVYSLLVVLVVKVVSSLVFNGLHLKYMIAAVRPLGICANVALSNYPRYIYMTIFISEIMTIGLTLVQACRHVRRSNSSWVAQLYRNGIIYSLTVLFLSIGSVIIPSLSPQNSGLFVRPQRVLESVLCNRLIFIILKQRLQRDDAITFTTFDNSHLDTSFQDSHSRPTTGQNTHSVMFSKLFGTTVGPMWTHPVLRRGMSTRTNRSGNAGTHAICTGGKVEDANGANERPVLGCKGKMVEQA